MMDASNTLTPGNPKRIIIFVQFFHSLLITYNLCHLSSVTAFSRASNLQNHTTNGEEKTFAEQHPTNHSYLDFPEHLNINVDLFLSQVSLVHFYSALLYDASHDSRV